MILLCNIIYQFHQCDSDEKIEHTVQTLTEADRTFFRAHSNASYILNQCIKTFHMSHQAPLYALFHVDPLTTLSLYTRSTAP